MIFLFEMHSAADPALGRLFESNESNSMASFDSFDLHAELERFFIIGIHNQRDGACGDENGGLVAFGGALLLCMMSNIFVLTQ